MFTHLFDKKFNNLKVVEGDLFKLAENGDFDVIVQGNNCFNTQGAGIAVIFNRLFNTLDFPKETIRHGDKTKLGEIDYKSFSLKGNTWVEDENGKLFVVNSYTQYGLRNSYNSVAADYKAIETVFNRLNTTFKGKRIGLPAIGAGLAGGDIDIISDLMDSCLTDCTPTLVIL